MHAPFSLLPNVLPRAQFEAAQELAPRLNLLVDRVAADEEWLRCTLAPVLGSDPFTAKLAELWEAAPPQATRLGLHRSDYMLHQPTQQFLQVEMNTIASSFGCVSAKLAALHRFLLLRYTADPRFGPDLHAVLAELGADVDTVTDALPANPTLERLPDALAAAHSLYGAPAAVVVFAVQPGERNVVDQRLLELSLWERHGVRVRRATLAELGGSATVGSNGALTLGTDEVAVVYFRAGYTPDDYPTELEWQGRHVVEASRAIKCPTLAYHLAGTKKVQEALSQEGQVERFLDTPADAAAVRACFAELHPAGPDRGPVADAAVADAMARPEAYVLKPQREGGGNNFYGAELRAKLEQGPAALGDLILMQRIMPPQQPAWLVTRGAVTAGATLSEFGVFGTFLASGDDAPVVNEYAGQILRTKLDGVDEGGVATGYAVLSSPLLV